jgi:hypothetical protein
MMNAIDYRAHIDPEYRRWGRKYPRFPGVAECIRLLKAGNVRGAWLDIIHHELTTRAGECLSELTQAFPSEDEAVKLSILHALEDARLVAAIPFLAELVRQRHERFSPIAEKALQDIGTKEARVALWGSTRT